MKFSAVFIALAIACSALHSTSSEAEASTFHSWKVANVAWDDALNIRKYPSSKSQILTAHQNGVKLSLTGRCTNGLNLNEIHYPSNEKLKSAVRYKWCEVWINPAGDDQFMAGWTYGKYIEPNN